jgi:hypothetical protein
MTGLWWIGGLVVLWVLVAVALFFRPEPKRA